MDIIGYALYQTVLLAVIASFTSHRHDFVIKAYAEFPHSAPAPAGHTCRTEHACSRGVAIIILLKRTWLNIRSGD
jgi:hypothetical protein